MLYLIALGGGVALVIGYAPNASAADEKLDAKRDLIVFVGKRLSVTRPKPTPPPKDVILFDEEFKARYQVLHVVFGSYKAKEITFTVYDHYGVPQFARYDTVLLFVARYKNKFYHEKYELFPVYPTADGRWASCGNPDQWETSNYYGKLKAVPIKFSGKLRDETTKRPCTKGNYVEDLLRLEQNGVLKARGWVF